MTSCMSGCSRHQPQEALRYHLAVHGLESAMMVALPPSCAWFSASAASRVHPVKLHSFFRRHLDAGVINLLGNTLASEILLQSLLRGSQLLEDGGCVLPLVSERPQVLLHRVQMALHLIVNGISNALSVSAGAAHGKLLVESTKGLLMRFELLFGLGKRHLRLGNRFIRLLKLGLELLPQVVGLVYASGQLRLRLVARPRALALGVNHHRIAFIAKPHCVLLTFHRLGYEFPRGGLARLFVLVASPGIHVFGRRGRSIMHDLLQSWEDQAILKLSRRDWLLRVKARAVNAERMALVLHVLDQFPLHLV
mmetsp:Transcript_86255/g.239181  ORF Transcript_86255/g.239181 Transcript_86255/m.239181 type:complete len:308 (-) Transcript_86255:755-1678(-)